MIVFLKILKFPNGFSSYILFLCWDFQLLQEFTVECWSIFMMAALKFLPHSNICVILMLMSVDYLFSFKWRFFLVLGLMCNFRFYPWHFWYYVMRLYILFKSVFSKSPRSWCAAGGRRRNSFAATTWLMHIQLYNSGDVETWQQALVHQWNLLLVLFWQFLTLWEALSYLNILNFPCVSRLGDCTQSYA